MNILFEYNFPINKNIIYYFTLRFIEIKSDNLFMGIYKYFQI